MKYSFEPERVDAIENLLRDELVNIGIHMVALIDLAGNVIADFDNGETNHDITTLAALAAGNFGAVSVIAEMIGEEEFSMLFHKGGKENIHFGKVMDEFILISVFGNDLSLGILRLKIETITKNLEGILTG